VEILVPKTHLGKSRLSFAGWRTREARRKERGCLSHVGHKRMGIGGHSLTKHSQQEPTANKQPSSLHHHLSNEELQGLEGGRKTDHDLSRSLQVDYQQTEYAQEPAKGFHHNVRTQTSLQGSLFVLKE
jgi:hypothetical protein